MLRPVLIAAQSQSRNAAGELGQLREPLPKPRRIVAAREQPPLDLDEVAGDDPFPGPQGGDELVMLGTRLGGRGDALPIDLVLGRDLRPFARGNAL